MTHRLRSFCFFTVFLILTLSASLSLAASFQAVVVAVSSGDTLKVLRSGKVIKVHLEGIDCPDKGQDYAQQARRFTEDVAFGTQVAIRTQDESLSGHIVAEVFLLDGRSLNRELVKAGLAWWDIRTARDSKLGKIERQARKKKVGLWKAKRPVPPWEARDRGSGLKPKR